MFMIVKVAVMDGLGTELCLETLTLIYLRASHIHSPVVKTGI